MEYRIYFFTTAAFGTFTWLFFLATFDLKGTKTSEEESKSVEENLIDVETKPIFAVEEA